MFTNEIKSAKNVYDIMAISYVLMNEEKDFNSNFASENFDIKIILTKYLEDKIFNPFNAFISLKQELSMLSEQKSFSATDYYSLLLEIDSCEQYDYKSSLFSDEAFKTYNALNTLYKEKVMIYPVLVSNYREQLNSIYKMEYKNNYLRDRKSYDNQSINHKLNNYIFFESNNYNINVHELIEYDDFIKCIGEKKSINVAMFPVTSINIHDILNIEYTKNKCFNIQNMVPKMEKMIIDRCQKFINNLDIEIDFLILPEMLMTDSIIQSIKDVLGKKEIKFIFLGSIWSRGSNVCHVFYENEEIFRYCKKIPFDLKYTENEFKEIINKCSDKEQVKLLTSLLNQHNFQDKISFQEQLNNESNIHIIDINNFGRILTFICKDIDDDSYMNISRIFQGDFIFLPACSPSLDLIGNAASLSERYHCTVMMCNTCSSLCKNEDLSNEILNKKNIGFITTPAKDDATRSHQKYFYTFDERCENCNMGCDGRIFTIDMEELRKSNTSVSLDIKEISG